MDAQRVLIVDSNEDFRLAVARALQTFHYVRCCGNGKEALEHLRRERPEILVLSMMLPELDGLMLLETIASENILPMVLAVTTICTDYLTASASRLGIEYILMKPCTVEAVVARVLDMKRHLKALPPKRTPEQVLEQLLQPLGIVPGLSHYPAIRECILLMARDPDNLLCKTIFPEVAQRCNITVNALESGIRRIIESCWDPDAWQTCFPNVQRRPSTKTFLRQMARLLREAME